MPSFAEQLAAFGLKTKGQVDAVVVESVREAGQRLIDRSPIDTGRFKSNWNYGLQSPDTTTTQETKIRTVNGINDLPPNASGFLHYLTNALPYGPALERGHSKQAPNGMVGLTVVEWPQIVDQAALKVVAGNVSSGSEIAPA